MACGCNKKGNVTNTNNTSDGQQKQSSQKLPLVTTNSSAAKKTALANVSKKISNRQKWESLI